MDSGTFASIPKLRISEPSAYSGVSRAYNSNMTKSNTARSNHKPSLSKTFDSDINAIKDIVKSSVDNLSKLLEKAEETPKMSANRSFVFEDNNQTPLSYN